MTGPLEFVEAAHKQAEKIAQAAAEEHPSPWTAVDVDLSPLDQADAAHLNDGRGKTMVMSDYTMLEPLRHAALHDPAAVLRRIAAERKVCDRHQPFETLAIVEAPNIVGKVTLCAHDRRSWPCPDITDLAEAWGWQEEQR